MKFSTKEDLEIPIAAVFSMLSDFEAYERAAMRRGADVLRDHDAKTPIIGMRWIVRAQIRGKLRKVAIILEEIDAPSAMGYALDSPSLKGAFEIELVAMSRNRTRMRMALDVRPKTLPARLLMQSAKLARNTLNKRYKSRVKNFARDLEDRYKRNPPQGGSIARV